MSCVCCMKFSSNRLRMYDATESIATRRAICPPSLQVLCVIVFPTTAFLSEQGGSVAQGWCVFGVVYSFIISEYHGFFYLSSTKARLL